MVTKSIHLIKKSSKKYSKIHLHATSIPRLGHLPAKLAGYLLAHCFVLALVEL